MSSVKVLLVDDVKLFIEFERSFFERAGCVILSATSGDEALRLVREEKPHIVLLDYEMPGMMGDEVCRRIKESEATRHIPVLIVTAHRTQEIVKRCLKAGCTDFVTKPVSGRELLDKVVKILEIPYRVHLRTRVNMEVAVGLSGEAVSLIGYSEDISEGGLFVESLEPLEVGTQVTLTFTLPGQPRQLQVKAVVARVSRLKERGMYGVGLRYVSPDAVFSEMLRSFVMQEVGR
jgi:uncharacterized protein (TIGR02266 family)